MWRTGPGDQRHEAARQGVARGFLAFFIVAIIVHVSVPWKVAYPSDALVSAKPSLVWAHQYAEQSFLGTEVGFGGKPVPDPTGAAMAGGIVGVVLCLAWLILATLAPPALLTREREAAFAATLGIPLMLLLIAGGRGIAHGLQFTDQVGDAGGWGWSPAGFALFSFGGLGAFALAAVMLVRLPLRRACVGVLFGALLAVGLLHAVPWLAIGDPSEPTTTYVYYDLARLEKVDGPVSLVGIAVIVALLGAVAWSIAAAFTVHSPRAGRFVDGAFAVGAVAPLLLGARGVGNLLGASLASAIDGREQWIVSVNGFVFASFLLALLLAVVGTSRAAVAEPSHDATEVHA